MALTERNCRILLQKISYLDRLLKYQLETKKYQHWWFRKRKVEDMKSSIKTASFTYKKVSKIKSIPFFLPSLIESASHIASYHATTTGAALHGLIPKALIEFAESKKIKQTKLEDDKGIVIEKCVLQRPESERFDIYKSLIREEFAKKSSVFLCLPTIEEAERCFQFFKKGIENYAFLLHGIEKLLN